MSQAGLKRDKSERDALVEPVVFGSLAEDLVNSWDGTRASPESLNTGADLRAFLSAHELPTRDLAPADLDRVRSLRLATRAIFESSSVDARLRSLNRLLGRAALVPGLRAKDDATAVLCWRVAAKASLIERLGSAVALNLASLVERFGWDRVRVCSGVPCRDVFVDVSKNGMRRYCALRCGNRVRAASFRAR